MLGSTQDSQRCFGCRTSIQRRPAAHLLPPPPPGLADEWLAVPAPPTQELAQPGATVEDVLAKRQREREAASPAVDAVPDGDDYESSDDEDLDPETRGMSDTQMLQLIQTALSARGGDGPSQVRARTERSAKMEDFCARVHATSRRLPATCAENRRPSCAGRHSRGH